MQYLAHRHAAAKKNPLSRIRYQLGGSLLIAAVAPYLLRIGLFPDAGVTPGLFNTMMAAVLAILLGEYFLRSIGTYPGVKAAAYALPIFLSTFALVVGFMVMGRIEYNRINLTASLVACVSWYGFVLTSSSRTRWLTIGYVPYGDIGELVQSTGVAWLRLDSVDQSLVGLDGIVADLRADLPDEWERMLAKSTLDGVIVYHSKQLSEALTGRVRVDHLSENTFGSLMPMFAYLRTKVVIDFVVALIALPAIAVILFVVWVMMTISGDRGGPFIFRQQRVGYRGRTFTMYKIRTMRHDVGPLSDDAARTAAMTGADDPRITSLGRRLRKLRIDELPQVINILRGEMSWIGPRPEAAALSSWYQRELPFYSYRHVVRPGLTGWAQVNQGHVANVDEVREKLQNDFYYIKFFSPWLDVVIVIRTIRTILTGFGAR